MDRIIKTTIAGIERQLCYSVSVMFDMTDKYGNIQKALDIIQNDGRDSFDAVKWFAIKMANEGELCRRDAGYDPLPMVTEKDISPHMAPIDYAVLRAAVVDAIGIGYRRDIDDDEEEEKDLGLEELTEKKTKAGE